MILCHFQSIQPGFLLEQETTLHWLALAHARAEAAKSPYSKGLIDESFVSHMDNLFRRFGCSSKHIRTRRVAVEDFTHTDWERMQLFSFADNPHGPTMSQRSDCFRKIGKRVCGKAFPESLDPPDHLIHVTCTGYISPSCAQEVVVTNRWHERTVVTHAYHMGCHASLPAIRIANGLISGASSLRQDGVTGPQRADILHTEVCSIHLQTGDPSPEQLVVQSLFADGFIKYSVVNSTPEALAGSGLFVESMHEVLIPYTLGAMSWDCTEWGMRMGLSRDVPHMIAASLETFVEELCRRAGVSFQKIRPEALFAIHPGGPKIIDRVQEMFHLSEEQIRISRTIMATCGNMSSATLPHIWEAIVSESSIPDGTMVVSLAFGPGLSISGALMTKVS
ncbi:MAG: type III polyketide synthase [Candidatus Riflebacteria bacterium]|nr:type III polyketide synthase [Candidatus Riflebacteria bacterium]